VNPSALVQLSKLDGLSRFQHEAMATTFSFHLAETPGVDLPALAEEAFRLVDQIEDLLSFYREGSDVTRINRANAGDNVRVHEITHQCLLTALEVSAASENVFEPFAGGPALTAKQQKIPPHLIDRVPPQVNDLSPVLSLDANTTQITKLGGTRWLDLGAIGKGAALDAVANLLHEWEVPTAVLVSGGSSVLVFGSPLDSSENSWPLTIPLDPAPVEINVPTPFALGASGQGFQPGHVITSSNVSARPQAVVLSPSAAVADALSTTALLLDDARLKTFLGDDPTFSALATHTHGPTLQTGIFESLQLSQIEATLVIPCWCESQRLPTFLTELTTLISQSKRLIEIIVVDDGSPAPEPAKTAKIIERLRADHKLLRPLVTASHHGKGGAIYQGWRSSHKSSRWLAFVDADGAVPATEVLRGLETVLNRPNENCLLAASRYHQDRSRPVHRGLIRQRTGGWFARWARRQLQIGAHDSQCGFKIVPSTWWKSHPSWQELGYAFDLELLLAARSDQVEILNFPISWREIGGSNVTWRDGMELVKTVRRLRR
jgi:thiamine biosynthesis lipoprotein ApbE